MKEKKRLALGDLTNRISILSRSKNIKHIKPLCLTHTPPQLNHLPKCSFPMPSASPRKHVERLTSSRPRIINLNSLLLEGEGSLMKNALGRNIVVRRVEKQLLIGNSFPDLHSTISMLFR